MGEFINFISRLAYISSVYSLFSNRVGLPLPNIPSSGVLLKSIGAEFLRPVALPDVNPKRGISVSNSYKYNMAGTQLIQLYKLVCTISIQNINLHSKPPCSCLLRHTWVKAVMPF